MYPMTLMRRAGLLNRMLPPTEDYSEGYQLNGVLPMLRLWVIGVADHAVYDWASTWRIIRQDQPWINRALPGDVWKGRR
jgi:hypothetical protein